MELYIIHIICSMRMDQPYLLIEKAVPQEAPTVDAEYQAVMGKNSGTVCSNLSSVDDHSSDSPFISHPVASVLPVQCKAHYECLEAKNKHDQDGTCSHCSSICVYQDGGSVVDEIVEAVDDPLSLLMKGKKKLQSFLQKFTFFGTENSELKECFTCTNSPVIYSTSTDEDSAADVDFAYKQSKLICPLMHLDGHHNICFNVEKSSEDGSTQDCEHSRKHLRGFVKNIHTVKEASKKPATCLPPQRSFSGDREHKEVNICAILSEERKHQYSDLKIDERSHTSSKCRSHEMFQTSQLDDNNDLRTPGTCHNRGICSASGENKATECILKMAEQPFSDGQCELCCRKIQNIDVAAPGIIDVPEATVKIKKWKQRSSCKGSHKQFCKLRETESQPPRRKRRGKLPSEAGQVPENLVCPLADDIMKPKDTLDVAHLEKKINGDMVCLDLPLTNFGFYSGEVLILM